MSTNQEFEYRPTCQGRTAGDCSNCGLAYDCVRARSGRTFAWPLATIAFGLVAALLVQGLTG